MAALFVQVGHEILVYFAPHEMPPSLPHGHDAPGIEYRAGVDLPRTAGRTSHAFAAPHPWPALAQEKHTSRPMVEELLLIDSLNTANATGIETCRHKKWGLTKRPAFQSARASSPIISLTRSAAPRFPSIWKPAILSVNGPYPGR